MSKITVVGSLNMDLVTAVPRLPVEGETVAGESIAFFPGGKGANQAVCAARLGGAVRMIGRLGQDPFAAQLRQSLQAAGVDTGCVRDVSGASGTAAITVTPGGANTIIVVPGANATLGPAELEEHRTELREASIVLAQLEIPLATVEYLAGLAEGFGLPLMLDPAPAQDLPASLLRRVTWLTPNEKEACTLLAHLDFPCEAGALEGSSLAAAARRLLATGVKNVALKLGARGVFLLGDAVRATLVPAHAVEAVDTTAAGDAFNGGFAYALIERQMEPAAAARFACAVSAVSVTRHGAQTSLPTLAEVEDLLRSAAA